MTEVERNAASGTGGMTGKDMRELPQVMKIYLDWGLSHMGVVTVKIHQTYNLYNYPFLIIPLLKVFRSCRI